MYCLKPVLLIVAIACLYDFAAAGDNDKYLFADEADFIAPYVGWLKIGIRRVKCGVSLVASRWALTAASCSGSDIALVTFGDTNRDVDEGTEQTFQVLNSFDHPDYNSTSKENDLALLYLDSEANFTANVQPLGILPDDDLVDRIVAKKCRTGGFGYIVPERTGLVNDQSAILSQDMVSSESCGDSMVPDTGYCFESRTNTSWIPCEGDVGSPIICKRKRVWLHAGVISGLNMEDGCAGPVPKVATPTSAGYDWILSIISG